MDNSGHFRFSTALLLTLVLLTCSPLMAAKVTLDPANWGRSEGNACIDCHRKSSAALAQQWHESAHAEAGVNCYDCHQADPADADALEHEGNIIATIVSPRDCGRCHQPEYDEVQGSPHSKSRSRLQPLLTGERGEAVSGCTACHGSEVKVKGDGSLDPSGWPNTGIGRINPDGSRGSCSSCHGRHRFSKAQARDPAACTWCHSGSESPDAEAYGSSKHGMLFAANRESMNASEDQWVLGKDYSAAPTCVTCHMGASPGLKPTHDVGMRSAWDLNGALSEQHFLVILEDGDRVNVPVSEGAPKRGGELTRPDGSVGKVKAVADPKRRRQAMMKTCLECHSKGFASGALKRFDDLVKRYNREFAEPAQKIMQELQGRGLLTAEPFDEPVERAFWRLWHDGGLRARHGAAMSSAELEWSGMRQVEQTFYGEFLPQLRLLLGDVEGDEIIGRLVTGTGLPPADGVPVTGRRGFDD